VANSGGNRILRPAKNYDVRALAVLHSECIPYSINSKLGGVWLRALYTQFLASPGRISIVATGEGGDSPIGGIFASSLSQLRLVSTLPRVSLAELRSLNWIALFQTRIVDYFDFFQVLRLISRLGPNEKGLYINSWFAYSSANSPRIGSQLLNRLLSHAQRDGFILVYVDVRRDNTRAIEKYMREGFAIYRSTKLSHLLAKDLTGKRVVPESSQIV